MPHTNPFAPDPSNPYSGHATGELETYADSLRGKPNTLGPSIIAGDERLEELSRREDVDTAVGLWERLCAVDFVRGETQGQYLHSTVHLSPDTADHLRNVKRMPDTAELEALVLSDGEETAYPPHDAQPAYDPSIPDLTAEQRAETYYHEDENPWSHGDRLYPITLTLISCGDYHGSDVDAANNRALRGTPGVDVREPNTGGQGSVFNVSTTVVGEMSSFENATSAGDREREPAARRGDALMRLESLVKQMEGLVEYALLDDEAHSELIDEFAAEAWDSWLESDTHAELINMGPGGSDAWNELLSDMGDELKASIRETYYAYDENEWNAESATAVVNGRHKDAVKHVARTLFGWSV